MRKPSGQFSLLRQLLLLLSPPHQGPNTCNPPLTAVTCAVQPLPLLPGLCCLAAGLSTRPPSASACQRRCRTRSRHLLSVTRNVHGTATEGQFLFCSKTLSATSPDEVNKHLSLLKESKLKSAPPPPTIDKQEATPHPTPPFFFLSLFSFSFLLFYSSSPIKNCTCPRLVTVVVAVKTQGLLTALLKEPSRSIFRKWKLEKQRRQKTV